MVACRAENAVTTLNNAGLIVDTDNYTFYEASDQPKLYGARPNTRSRPEAAKGRFGGA